MKRILFVCTGNTCRSPMAEAVLKHKSKFEVRSAGVFAGVGSPATQYSIDVLKEKNIPIDHSSSPLTLDLVEWSDLLLTMTNSHKQHVLQNFPGAADKIFTLKEFVDNNNMNQDIIDPFGGNVEIYRETLEEIETNIDQLLKRLN